MKLSALTLQSTIQKPDYWLKKNWYYHSFIGSFYRFCIPAGMRVLQVQCKTGFLLNTVKPAYGVGIDTEVEFIEHARTVYPHLNFFSGSLNELKKETPFDYIILSSTTMEVDDIQNFFKSL